MRVQTVRGFIDGSVSKESAYNVGDLVLIPGWGRSLEKGMAIHSSILAWRIPWTEEPGGQQSMGLQRVEHDWVTSTSFITKVVSGKFQKRSRKNKKLRQLLLILHWKRALIYPCAENLFVLKSLFGQELIWDLDNFFTQKKRRSYHLTRNLKPRYC